jgi:hypothetical protein
MHDLPTKLSRVTLQATKTKHESTNILFSGKSGKKNTKSVTFLQLSCWTHVHRKPLLKYVTSYLPTPVCDPKSDPASSLSCFSPTVARTVRDRRDQGLLPCTASPISSSPTPVEGSLVSGIPTSSSILIPLRSEMNF